MSTTLTKKIAVCIRVVHEVELVNEYDTALRFMDAELRKLEADPAAYLAANKSKVQTKVVEGWDPID